MYQCVRAHMHEQLYTLFTIDDVSTIHHYNIVKFISIVFHL